MGISQQCDFVRYSLDTVCQSLYLAGLFSNPETVKMLNQNGMFDCSCLASTQEEADTRIILHALYSVFLKNEIQWGFHNNATLYVILLIQFARIQCMQNYAGIRLFLCACQTTAIEHTILIQRHGRSNIVFSSSVSIGDAINTSSQFKSDHKVAQMTLRKFMR
jgi:hypothetical protein